MNMQRAELLKVNEFKCLESTTQSKGRREGRCEMEAEMEADDPLWSPMKGTAERKRLENCVLCMMSLNHFIIKIRFTRDSFHCLDFMQSKL